MHDELTKQDIRLMQQELEDRIQNQRPVLLEEVKRCREFGDLSENFEYKEAKRAKNRNESRGCTVFPSRRRSFNPSHGEKDPKMHVDEIAKTNYTIIS